MITAVVVRCRKRLHWGTGCESVVIRRRYAPCSSFCSYAREPKHKDFLWWEPSALHSLLVQANETKRCETGTERQDPCATIDLRGRRVTVEWDQQTKVITYVFTDDRRLFGDSELSVGGSCRIIGDSNRGESRFDRYGRWPSRQTGRRASANVCGVAG